MCKGEVWGEESGKEIDLGVSLSGIALGYYWVPT